MTPEIPDTHRDLVEKPVFATMVTLMPDGTPQASLVWWKHIDGFFYVSMWTGGQKYKNLLRDPRVTFLAFDPADPGRYIEVRGEVVAFEDGSDEWMDTFSLFYEGKRYYGELVPEESRADPIAIVKVKPLRIRTRTG
jgi:PPOX class probable F420-dependent enzyme